MGGGRGTRREGEFECVGVGERAFVYLCVCAWIFNRIQMLGHAMSLYACFTLKTSMFLHV